MHLTVAASDLKLDGFLRSSVHYVPRDHPYPTELKPRKPGKPPNTDI